MDRRIAEKDKPVTRICKTCGIDKTITDYYMNKGYRMRICAVCHMDRTKAWRKTPAGRVSVLASDQSITGKARYRRYRQTDKYQVSQDKYRQSDKGKATSREYLINFRKNSPDNYKAYNAIAGAVARGELVYANTLPCAAQLEHCTGDAMEYHHHNGYDEEHKFDVVPVCSTCHRELEAQAGGSEAGVG